jgi:protein TonB
MRNDPPAPSEDREPLPEVDAPAVAPEEFHAEPEAEPVEFEQPIEPEPEPARQRAMRLVRLTHPLPRTRAVPKPTPQPTPRRPRPPPATPRRATPPARAAPHGPTRGPVLLNLAQAQPVYPRAALRRGDEGVVVLSVDVGRDGTVLRVEVTQSSGHGALDRAAVRAAKKWRFRPALDNGRPVAARYVRTVRFKLLDG